MVLKVLSLVLDAISDLELIPGSSSPTDSIEPFTTARSSDAPLGSLMMSFGSASITST